MNNANYSSIYETKARQAYKEILITFTNLSSTHKRPIKIKLEKVSRKNAPEYFKSLSCDGGATRVAWIKDARHLSTVHVFSYLSVSLVMPWHDNLQQFMRFVTSRKARPKKSFWRIRNYSHPQTATERGRRRLHKVSTMGLNFRKFQITQVDCKASVVKCWQLSIADE